MLIEMQQLMQVLVLCFILGGVWVPHVSGNSSDDIDPFDMENFDSASMKMRKREKKQSSVDSETMDAHIDASQLKEEEVESSDGNVRYLAPNLEVEKEGVHTSPPVSLKKAPPACPAHFLFQQFISRLLLFVRDKIQQTDEQTPTEICLHLSLLPSHLEFLESFRKDDTGGGTVDTAHDILTHAMHGAHTVGADNRGLHILWLEERLGVSVEKAVQLLILAVLFIVMLLVMTKLKLQLRLFAWLLFLAVLVSVLTTWYRLYKGEVAKQHNALMKDLPAGCATLPEESSLMENFVNLVRHYFMFQKDTCVEYYEHVLVDPLVKVSIMEALAVAVVQTLLKPMRTVGTELSEFMRALLKDLPVQWQFLTVIIVFFFIFLALFMSCGYCVRIPFLLAIEPTHTNKAKEVRDLQQQVLKLKSQVENIGTRGAGENAQNYQAALPQANSTQPEALTWANSTRNEALPQANFSRLDQALPQASSSRVEALLQAKSRTEELPQQEEGRQRPNHSSVQDCQRAQSPSQESHADNTGAEQQ